VNTAGASSRTGDNPVVDSVTPGTVIPGTLIADRYRLVRPLGSGSSATVWEASDTALDRTVAVKLLHGSAVANPTERERLRREARALAKLAHPRITIVFDYVEQRLPDGTPQPVLVTELLHGTTLGARLRTGPLPAAEAVAVCAQLADALRAAHDAGIVHRDVKPGNVVLTPSGAKLLDFGIAQAATDSNLTGNMAIGTPACMAPEQLTGRGAVPASDVYALGCVLYWCLTGHPPYESDDLYQVAQAQLYSPAPPLNVAGLSPIVVDVYTRCMAKDAAQRPTAAEVYARLTQAAKPPIAQRTLVMPASDVPTFDVPTQPTSLPGGGVGSVSGVGGVGTAGGTGGAGGINDDGVSTGIGAGDGRVGGAGGGRSSGAAAPSGQPSRARLMIGALVVALVAAGVTALALSLSNKSGANASAPPTASASGAGATTPSSAQTPTPSPSAAADTSPTANPNANATLPDPAADPNGYLEGMRGQIDGLIAQGQNTIDPNTGRDLQNSLADLENAITAVQNDNGGGGNARWRDVRHKINGVAQKINDGADNGRISQDAADQLTGELQDLSDALPGSND